MLKSVVKVQDLILDLGKKVRQFDSEEMKSQAV